jgi:Cof subfamily protein (haloacid dehalogenase superfamily)
MPLRLLALDVDGTLLDPEGVLRPTVREAVRAARERGLSVVLCTGRRYRTALPILEQLELEGPAVLHNGVVVKDARSGRTLHHNYLPDELYTPALAIMRSVAPPLVYVDRFHQGLDIVAEPADRAHAFQAEYLADNSEVTRVVASLDGHPPGAVVMLSCMADESTLRALHGEVKKTLSTRVRTNFVINKNYRGHILEIVSAASGKWPALHTLIRERGIAPKEVLAIGDDTNDAEMVRAAGLGVAMGNAGSTVKAAADYVASSNADDGVVEAIERFILDPAS